MKAHKSKIGKNLLGMLMFQMYDDSRLIYREYIQNARDAINDAVRMGLLNKITDGHISINIDSANRIITITDNGTGISQDRVESVLLNIADSDKDGETSAGQFGIGRLVGGYFCKKLSFKTSFQGENIASEIIFDVEKIKSILDDDNDHRTATEVIDIATDRNTYEEAKEKHYFIVTLENIHEDYPVLLNEDEISDYLKEVAPIDYSTAFKNQLILTNTPNDFVELQKNVGHFQISVNNNTDIRKRYGLRIEGTDDSIIGLDYFHLKDDNDNLLAWGWYAVTHYTKAIPVSDKNRGFRLRKHNIQVGDANTLIEFFPRNETRGNNYFYGEIHIVNQRIKLNSARNGLAPTPEGECLKSLIRNRFSELTKLYHLANDVKKDIERTIEEIESADITTLPDITKLCEESIQRFEGKKNAQTEAAQKMIGSYKQRIEDAIENKQNPDLQPQSQTVTQPKPTITPQPKRATDPFEILQSRFSSNEIELIKRVFHSFSCNCPYAKKKLIEELSMKVIKDLSK